MMITDRTKRKKLFIRTDLIDKVFAQEKIHQFVISDQWRAGMIIDFHDQPIKAAPSRFFLTSRSHALYWTDYKIADAEIDMPVCSGTEHFELDIKPIKKGHKDFVKGAFDQFETNLKISSFFVNDISLLDLVANFEGFYDSTEFIKYMYTTNKKHIVKGKLSITGLIVHWTDQFYDRKNVNRR